MDIANELLSIISIYFSGNKARVSCMTNILIGLLKALSTNLIKVANNVPGKTKTISKYRRIQRFFEQITLSWDIVANFIIDQIKISSKFTLILDRTNWKFGTKNINFLVLAIAWHGISIPVYWTNLNRAGNSNTKERMLILSQIINLIGIDNIEVFLGDREFVGADWLHWLQHYGIKFIIRIKQNFKIYRKNKYRKIIKSFRSLSRNSVRYINCSLWELDLVMVGYKDKKGNVCILATNSTPETALELYSIRWQIESMFLCLKSRGFDLESTNITDPEKLDTLFGLLAILTCWNCKIGYWYNEIKPIQLKKHGRPEQNLFHYGMRIISSIFNNVVDYHEDFKRIINLLKLPDLQSCCNSYKSVQLACM